MKNSRLTARQTFRSIASFILFLFAASFIISCATSRSGSSTANEPVEIPDELSLKADRSALDEDRKEIPEAKRKENDELALVLQMMTAKNNQEPSEIRNRFNSALRKKRELNDKNLRQRRDDYTNNERRVREDFLKKLKTEREDFARGKRTPDERKRFFEDQDQKRKDAFANEADKRKDFESKMTEDRKNFEDYAREQTNRFGEQIRAYSADLLERRNQEALKKRTDEKAKQMNRDAQTPSTPSRSSKQFDPNDEFSSIPAGPAIPLGAPTGN